MNKLKTIVIGALLMVGVVGVTGAATLPAYAEVNPQAEICKGTGGKGGANCGGNSTQDDLGDILTTIVNTLLYVIGAVAVIVIVVAGLRYVTSGGDASRVTAAKNTILYAVVGLIVAILAYAIVNFVLRAFN